MTEVVICKGVEGDLRYQLSRQIKELCLCRSAHYILCVVQQKISPIYLGFFFVQRWGEGSTENETKFCFTATILQLKVTRRQFYEKLSLEPCTDVFS